MNSIVYSVPAASFPGYRGHTLIVRSHDPAELVAGLSTNDLGDLACIQLLSLPADFGELVHWGETVPVDIVLRDPSDFPLLYRYARLLDNHPVRVSIPVVSGFAKAVKLAASLQFAVKLELDQPDATLVGELEQVLDIYLHQATVSQSVDYFHTILLAFYEASPINLWAVQEEDPTMFRYITEAGEETLNGRLASAPPPSDPGAFVERVQQELLAAQSECCDCEFWAYCGGYFKWPRREYACAGVKTLFRRLRNAADELKQDLTVHTQADGEPPQ